MDEEFPRRQLDDFRFLERQAHVGVAINGGDGRDFLQLGNDGGVADVARVQNVVHAGKQFQDFRVEEIVRVRNDADFIGDASSKKAGDANPSPL